MIDSKYYKIGAGVLIFIITLIIIFMVAGKKSSKKVAESNETPATVSSLNVIEENENKENFNELNEIKITSVDNTDEKNKVDSSVANKNTEILNNINDENKSNQVSSKPSEDEDKEERNVQDEEVVDPVFKYPVDGEISLEYAKEKLVHSNTLGEWITHPGIDIKADKTTVVKASAAGTVKSIKNDPRYGLTVVIEHVNGYTTVYSNLLTAEFVNVGENVSGGQTIGTVGNTASFEILDESHLHFEITKDGEQIDPIMYLKNS